MRRLSLILIALLLTAMSAAPAQGQTPGPGTPQTGASVDLAGVTPLPLTGERQAAFEAYIADMLAMTNVPVPPWRSSRTVRWSTSRASACGSWADQIRSLPRR